MREQLIQYVALLFAGAQDCEEIQQEILQNTLDRYDDLIAEGKVPEAAYRLAITGIGDINEILGTQPTPAAPVHPVPAVPVPADNDTPAKKLLRAIAVGLYILCPLPLIVLSDLGMDIIGLCGTLTLVAVATVLILLGGKKKYRPDGTLADDDDDEDEEPKSELQKSVSSLVWAIGLALYFIISFTTRCWHITWVIFPILSALDNFLCTILQNQETPNHDAGSPSQKKLKKSISGMIWAMGLALYFLISFLTGAWHITWLLFLITGAVQGLVRAILDYKEAANHET